MNLIRLEQLVVALAFALLLAGCGASYYLQAAAGQLALMRARQPMEQVLVNPATPTSVRRQLLVVDSALVFARVELGLPAGGSYRHYADIGRSAVVWNVFAAPEFSLSPREWCYPVAGCATYRGWFSEQRAQADAARLASGGDDVFVGGVAAYSTLGWFADPVLNTMLAGSDAGLAGLLFHELAHQVVYVPGDTLFNEGFATLVEEEGTRRWLLSRNDAVGLCRYSLVQSRRLAVLEVLAALRADLDELYVLDIDPELRRERKTAAFLVARQRYAALRSGWAKAGESDVERFDAWFDPGLNNAVLVALSSYEDYVPAFRSLLARDNGDLGSFYTTVEELGRREPAERERLIREATSISESGAAGSGYRGEC